MPSGCAADSKNYVVCGSRCHRRSPRGSVRSGSSSICLADDSSGRPCDRLTPEDAHIAVSQPSPDCRPSSLTAAYSPVRSVRPRRRRTDVVTERRASSPVGMSLSLSPTRCVLTPTDSVMRRVSGFTSVTSALALNRWREARYSSGARSQYTD